VSPRIHVLPENVVNLIAAGEVVERPASVVKELVENALDAGARHIWVELEGGGLNRITVRDDGCGMEADDLTLSVVRHATSKISSPDDLLAVASLGFRGEALPSMAAVSRLEILSRPAGGDHGWRLTTEGGSEPRVEPAAAPRGTQVTVARLFYNTPARRKYLKSPTTELGYVVTALRGLALVRPDVAFTARQGERELLRTAGRGDRAQCWAEIFGFDEGGQLLSFSSPDQRVRGLCGTPSLARSRRDRQFFVVNGRLVEHAGLRAALERSYRGFLLTRRYPAALVEVQVDTNRVDPNVHPAKREIRLSGEREVEELLHGAVRRQLLRLPAPRWQGAGPHQDRGRPAGPSSSYRLRSGSGQDPIIAPREQRLRYVPAAPSAPLTSSEGTGSPAESEKAGSGIPFAALRPLGQVGDSFIAAAGPDGLYLVDQHAAHERVYYERALQNLEQEEAASQALAVPVPLQVGHQLAELWSRQRAVFSALGFAADEFGGDTLLVRAVPAGGREGSYPAGLLFEVLEQYDKTGETLPPARRAAAVTAACQAAAKAGQSLSVQEMAALFEQLAACRQPATCPHGRPTALVLTLAELRRMFKRT